jgi:sirohydrochlorin ferrochelatase
MENGSRAPATRAHSGSRARLRRKGWWRKSRSASSTARRRSPRRSLRSPPARVIVYPLFASNGYFNRDRLVRILDEANGQNRAIHILPPLGLDPSLPKLLADRAAHVTREYGFSPEAVAVILLAHGSRRNPASREATGRLASEIARREVFRDVKIALLEERPHLQDAAQSIEGPAIVMGIFSGSGLHGARDAPRLVAKLARPEVIFAGAIGDAPGVDEVVGSSVLKALAERS